jgi:hypothetical protein
MFVVSGIVCNKTDHHDITEILLKVALNTIKQKYLPKTFVQSLPIPRDPPVIITTLPENRLVSAILTGPLQLLNKYQRLIQVNYRITSSVRQKLVNL